MNAIAGWFIARSMHRSLGRSPLVTGEMAGTDWGEIQIYRHSQNFPSNRQLIEPLSL